MSALDSRRSRQAQGMCAHIRQKESRIILQEAAYHTLLRAKAGSRAIPLETVKRWRWPQLWRRCFFGFSDAAGVVTGALPSGDADATGFSPLTCSRLTSRRGQAKSSARPAGADKGSPVTKTRVASASIATGRDPGPPSN